MNIKQLLINTIFGDILLNIRNHFDVIKIYYKEREAVGTLINDHLGADLVCQLCDSEKIFIDIGAHIGSIIAKVQRHDPSINIIAIEAIPHKATTLEKKFPNITVHQCAVSDYDGEIDFYINKKLSGYSSIISPNSDNKDYEKLKIKANKLDNLIDNEKIDVIKIDVEGAELSVISGGQMLIRSTRPIIYFESAPEINVIAGPNKEALWNLMQSLNYSVLLPNRLAHDDAGLTLHGFLESHHYPRRTTNYFGIPIERRNEIRMKARKILKLI